MWQMLSDKIKAIWEYEIQLLAANVNHAVTIQTVGVIGWGNTGKEIKPNVMMVIRNIIRMMILFK